jgi:hypothetical protein
MVVQKPRRRSYISVKTRGWGYIGAGRSDSPIPKYLRRHVLCKYALPPALLVLIN